VVGFSLCAWESFCERICAESFACAKAAFEIAKTANISVSVLDIASDVKIADESAELLEKNARILSQLLDQHFPAEMSLDVYARAATYFAEACHFLFTKIDNKQTTEFGDTEYHIDWPLTAPLPKHVKPVPCSPVSTRKNESKAKLVYEAAALESALQLVRVRTTHFLLAEGALRNQHWERNRVLVWRLQGFATQCDGQVGQGLPTRFVSGASGKTQGGC
jgi:hypothetical protein